MRRPRSSVCEMVPLSLFEAVLTDAKRLAAHEQGMPTHRQAVQFLGRAAARVRRRQQWEKRRCK